MQTLEGKLHPITFHSLTFTDAKLNYDVHDKELLEIFKAFKHWRHYLNLIIRFLPSKLGAKPDALTRQWDIYLKEGGSHYPPTESPSNFH